MIRWLILNARAVRCALNFRRVLKQRRFVLPYPSSPTLGPPAPDDAVGIALRASRRAAFRLTNLDTCLMRSLILHELLSGWGGVEIRYGMRKQEGRLEGHAWVMVDGKAIGEDGVDLPSYAESQDVEAATRGLSVNA